VRGDDGRALVHSKGDLSASLDQLDAFAEGLSFLLGHNLIAFDLPHLAAAKPDLAILKTLRRLPPSSAPWPDAVAPLTGES